MARFIIRRLIFSIPILVIASVIVFAAAKEATSPLAGIRRNPRLSQQDIQNYMSLHGLDRPAHEQYLTWLGNFVQGDWGKSLLSNRPISPQIREAIANTLVLGVSAFILSLLIGVIIGSYSAVKPYSWFDYAATGGAFFGISVPTFWFALMVQIVFGLYFANWFGFSLPIAGMFAPGSEGFDLMDRLRHLALPALVLAVQLVAVYSRYMRSSMMDVLGSDYMRTARAKGLGERKVIVRHGMRNALIPLTTQAAIDIGALTGGLIVTERVFQWPGMGSLFLDAMERGDYAVVLPWTMIVVSSVILFNLLADVLYAVLDPRIRYA